MESDVLARLKSFFLSNEESVGVELLESDVSIGLEEGNRSLVGKKVNFVRVRNAVMKLWQHRGLCKVVTVALNVFQFVFEDASTREGVMQGRPWLFNNQLLVLLAREENSSWTDDRFSVFSMWIQVCYIPTHWLSIDTGRKIA